MFSRRSGVAGQLQEFGLHLGGAQQAQGLGLDIPMAVSLAFGVLFATLISLILVPAGYLIIEDLKELPGRLSNHSPDHSVLSLETTATSRDADRAGDQ